MCLNMCSDMYDGAVWQACSCVVMSLVLFYSHKNWWCSWWCHHVACFIHNFQRKTGNQPKPSLTAKIKATTAAASSAWQDMTSPDHRRYRPLSLSLSLSRSRSLALSRSLSRRGPPRSRSRCRSRSRRLLTTACVRRRKSSTRMS